MIIKPRLGIQLNRKNQLAEGLIGCWVFNEKTGYQYCNLAGKEDMYGNLLESWQSPAWIPDGLSFDADAAITNFVPPANNFSIVTNIKNVSAWDIIFDVAGSTTENCYFGIRANASSIYIVSMGHEYAPTITCTKSIQDGKSHQIVLTTSDKTRIYIDDDYLAETNVVVNSWNVGANRCGLGGYLDSTPGINLNGIIVYYYIYNRALTAAEIYKLNTNPYQMFQPTIDPCFYSFISGGDIDETGKIIPIISTVTSDDSQDYKDLNINIPITATITSTDFRLMFENLVIDIISTVTSSDSLAYNETNKIIPITVTVDTSDVQMYKEIANVLIEAIITKNDLQYYKDDVTININSNLEASDFQFYIDDETVNIICTVTETDTLHEFGKVGGVRMTFKLIKRNKNFVLN